MSEPTRVTRTLDSDLEADELWALVGDGAAWAEWMVDAAEVTVEPGAGGSVVDDGVERTVRIHRRDEGDDGGRVAFTWWPDDRPDLVSAVELVVLPAVSGSRLVVTETFAIATAMAAFAWDFRLLLVGLRSLAVRV